jgi:hypothetical protein
VTTARARLDGTVRYTVHVPHRLTREQMAVALARHEFYQPGMRARAGLRLIAAELHADANGRDYPDTVPGMARWITREPDTVSTWLKDRYTAALADIDSWRLYPQPERTRP